MDAPTYAQRPLDTAIYGRARAAGIPARHAARMARIAPQVLDWQTDRHGMPSARLSRDGFDVHVRCEIDYEDDPSDGIGTIEWPERYADPDRTPPGTVKITTRQGYAYWRSATPFASRVKYHASRGASRAVALDMARADLETEASLWDGTDGPLSYGVIAKAYRADTLLGSASCMGVSADWDPITRTDGTEHLEEIALDLIAEAITEATATLARLCGTDGCTVPTGGTE